MSGVNRGGFIGGLGVHRLLEMLRGAARSAVADRVEPTTQIDLTRLLLLTFPEQIRPN